jgi:hypothetical protein
MSEQQQNIQLTAKDDRRVHSLTKQASLGSSADGVVQIGAGATAITQDENMKRNATWWV